MLKGAGGADSAEIVVNDVEVVIAAGWGDQACQQEQGGPCSRVLESGDEAQLVTRQQYWDGNSPWTNSHVQQGTLAS